MIRIIAGHFKGKKIAIPDGPDIRPTTDRMRERIFSILSHHRYPKMAGARVADLFAGTGALGLEALSRGAAHVDFFEQDRNAVAALKKLTDQMGVKDQVTINHGDAGNIERAKMPADIIFMDAPYNKGLTDTTLAALAAGNWLSKEGVIVAECHKAEDISIPKQFVLEDRRTQGIQATLFIRPTE